jgi:hypothetical protein
MDEKRDPYMYQTSAETTSIKSQTIFLTDKNDWQQRGS